MRHPPNAVPAVRATPVTTFAHSGTDIVVVCQNTDDPGGVPAVEATPLDGAESAGARENAVEDGRADQTPDQSVPRRRRQAPPPGDGVGGIVEAVGQGEGHREADGDDQPDVQVTSPENADRAVNRPCMPGEHTNNCG